MIINVYLRTVEYFWELYILKISSRLLSYIKNVMIEGSLINDEAGIKMVTGRCSY